MKVNKNKQNSIYIFSISILIFLVSCQLNKYEDDVCSKYADEIYTEQKTESLKVEGHKAHEDLLKIFDEHSIKELNQEAYQFLFYSSFAYGKIIKFEKGKNTWTLNVKCYNWGDAEEECKEYQIEIDEEEWGEFEKMIYEFNFWTAENFRANKNVLDGYAFFLEGNRPYAEKCKKKTYKLVGRGSPRFDKMEALCENIMSYEDQLKFRYEQMNKIK